jgi:UDP-N-acetylmuramoyl-L-alanyl-D-glutamate--2,6-diaminopimelate ligase
VANPAKKLVRKVLKGKVLRTVEDEYRLARASFANARFNWPARGMRVIMITGTNGKTTTAHFLFSILRAAGYSVGLSSTAEFRINDQVEANTTNMTVIDPVELRRQIASFKVHQVDFVILEATSQALDQHRLWGIPCEVAIMTNLTQDHLDYHKTMDNYAAAKAKLWQFEPKYSILNKDDEWFSYYKKVATGKLFTYGAKSADITFKDYKAEGEHAKFTLELPEGKSVIKMALAGKYNMYNAVAAATAAVALKVSPEHIEEGIEALDGVSGRLEPVVVHKGRHVMVDYAHTPDGLEKVLGAVQDMTKGNLWLVFGACGDRDKTKRPIMGKIAGRLADKIVVTDEESYSEDPAKIRHAVIEGVKKARGGEGKMVEIADRKKAIKHALDNAKKGDLILITGLGHEQFRVEQGKKIRWNDADVVKKLLRL